MKKTLIAMAVLAAAGAASAQSSVTLYGRLDLGLSTSSAKNTAFTAAGAVSGTTKTANANLFGAEGSYTGSRLGVTGTEDLGGGKAAFFTYEMGINADNGAVAGATRVAKIGVQGGFGSVGIGTQYNAIDAARSLGNPGSSNFANKFSEGYNETVTTDDDLFTADEAFTTDFTGASAGHISGTSSNSLQYSSPTVSGVTAVLTLGSDSTKDTATTGVATNTKTTETILGLQYEAHGLSAQLAYGKSKSETPAVAAIDAVVSGTDPIVVGAAAVAAKKVSGTDLILVASYALNFGSVSASPRVMYEGSKGKDSVSGRENKRTYFGVGSGFEIGSFGPWVTVGLGKLKSNAGATATQDAKVKETGIEVGTTYTMSGRTSMYAFYNTAKETVKSGGVKLGEVKANGLAVGLVHKF